MDIMRKAVLFVTILSISVFMAGCGGEEGADDAGAGAQGDSGQADTSGLESLSEGIEKTQAGEGSAPQTESSSIGSLDELKEKIKENE